MTLEQDLRSWGVDFDAWYNAPPTDYPRPKAIQWVDGVPCFGPACCRLDLCHGDCPTCPSLAKADAWYEKYKIRDQKIYVG